jgi:hypothetical protein
MIKNQNISILLTLALFTGFIGDASLQILTSYGFGDNSGWGLNDYFKLHGSSESLFIAAGMLGIFYAFYIFILRLPINWYYISIYAILLDLLFRKFMIFPSLSGYYNYFNYFWSAVWAIIPMLIPLALFTLLKYYKVLK